MKGIHHENGQRFTFVGTVLRGFGWPAFRLPGYLVPHTIAILRLL
jgi:hypothetical protein